MNITELQKLWESEKESYRNKEIGSGVQFFVKKVLQCEQLFNLKEGKLSTADEARRNEFLEEPTKKNKRADIVVFITNEIVIPIEVERFENIEIGEKQLFEYQLVWDKKTGILTDGFEWRFYISKIPIKSFTITEILNKPDVFLVFWNEFIQPINYYINFFTQEIENTESVESLDIAENRQKFFIDITTLINSFNKKLNLKGYFDEYIKPQLANKDYDGNKFAIEITYSYLIQFILYKTLADNDFSQFKDDFLQRRNRLINNLNIQNYGDVLTVIKAISTKISENIYRPFSEEQIIINKKLEKILEKSRNELQEVTPWLDIFVFIQRYNFANIQSEIFGFIYENYLKQLYNENLGQYFTAPEVTDFMLEQIGYSGKELENQIKKDQISIIDPSCGSGTFLYGAVRNLFKTIENKQLNVNTHNLVTQNIFGIDVAEFPLYLAEMSIIMRMLPHIVNEKFNNPIDKKLKIFKTRDTVSEFLDTQIRNTLTDVKVALDRNKGQMNLFADSLNLEYESFIRNKSDLEELKRSLENTNEPRIDRYRFDYVIGNPPYISYNESSSKGVLFFDFIKQNKVKLSDVYGINLHSVPDNRKKYPPKPNLYAFFIAVGLALLKDYGKMCYIIPQTLLTESDYDVMRYYLAKYTTIKKIITFNNPLFVGRGIKQKNTVATSSLIFIVEKRQPDNAVVTEIVNYKGRDTDIGITISNINKGKNINKFTVKQGILLKNYLNWNFIKLNSDFIDFYNEYKSHSQDFSLYFDNTKAKNLFDSEFYFDVGFILDKNHEIEAVNNSDNFELIDFKNFIGYSVYIPTKFYPNDLKKIELPKNSQGYKILGKKYKIIWNKERAYKFYFSEKNILPNMSNQQIITSDNKKELFYLFAILNSTLNEHIFKKLFLVENEKSGLYIVVRRLKEFIKIPIITEKNQFIKNKVIALVEEIFSLEQIKLSDLVDFSNVMFQKIDNITFDENSISLHNENKSVKCKIIDKPELIQKSIHQLVFNQKILLHEIKNHYCIDTEEIKFKMKKINDFIFALYFNVNVDYGNIISLKDNKFYKYLNDNNMANMQ